MYGGKQNFENKPNTQLYYYKTKKDLLKENVKKIINN